MCTKYDGRSRFKTGFHETPLFPTWNLLYAGHMRIAVTARDEKSLDPKIDTYLCGFSHLSLSFQCPDIRVRYTVAQPCTRGSFGFPHASLGYIVQGPTTELITPDDR